jgi:hypothetical protein
MRAANIELHPHPAGRHRAPFTFRSAFVGNLI